MADKYFYMLQEPARLIYSSITEMSAPRHIATATPKYSATFGITEKDFEVIRQNMVAAIKTKMGNFSGNPADYQMCCLSGKAWAERAIRKADFDAQGMPADEAFKLKEKAEKNAAMFAQYAAILKASTKFDISLAYASAKGTIDSLNKENYELAVKHGTSLYPGAPMGSPYDTIRKDIGGKFFYPGAWVSAYIELYGTKRLTIEGKDGCSAYLRNVCHLRHDQRLGGGGSGPSNDKVFGSFAGYSDVDPTALAPGGAEQEPAEASW